MFDETSDEALSDGVKKQRMGEEDNPWFRRWMDETERHRNWVTKHSFVLILTVISSYWLNRFVKQWIKSKLIAGRGRWGRRDIKFMESSLYLLWSASRTRCNRHHWLCHMLPCRRKPQANNTWLTVVRLPIWIILKIKHWEPGGLSPEYKTVFQWSMRHTNSSFVYQFSFLSL